MTLIAKKPCSFGGRNFFIDEEIPESLVADVKLQEKLGVIAIVMDGIPGKTEGEAEESAVPVTVYGNGDFDTALLLSPEEINQVFSIMQSNADEGAKAITDVNSENVLILLHAADSRQKIKNAAKKQADNLFSTNGDLNESISGNAITDTNKEGADT